MDLRAKRTSSRPPSGGLVRSGERGFTLVELVVVMTVIAITAAVAMSRFADRTPFAVQAVADQLVSGLRLAQATAVAQRRSVYVTVAADPPALSLCLDAACTQPLSTPDGGSTWLTATEGTRIDAGAAFSFAASGAPSIGAALVLQVQSSDGTIPGKALRVEPVSGHVHQP